MTDSAFYTMHLFHVFVTYLCLYIFVTHLLVVVAFFGTFAGVVRILIIHFLAPPFDQPILEAMYIHRVNRFACPNTILF